MIDRHTLSGPFDPRACLQAADQNLGERGGRHRAALRVARNGAGSFWPSRRIEPRLLRDHNETRPFVGETVEMEHYNTTSVMPTGAEG